LTGQSTASSITAAATATDLRAGARGERVRLAAGTRPLKRWRYVAVFGEQLAACAALVQIGPARQSFWALALGGERMRERTRLRPRRGEVELIHGAGGEPGRLRVRDRGVELDLRLAEEAGIEALCASGRRQVFTRKQAGVIARGTLSLDGGPARAIDALAVIDDTCGYHQRRTEWFWSAGVGEGADGAALAWNLVSGVNDPPSGSERAVWVDGVPREVPPVRFAEDLRRISGADGSELRFHAEAQRSHSTNLIIFKSDYRAPFGAFSGSLPGGIALAHGLGVVERHRALW
jgi:Protein of unknown function (DUF2804)